MRKKKLKLPPMKVYSIFSELVENGVRGGYHKAHKYSDKPTEEEFVKWIHDYVMLEIDENFDFGGE